MSRDLHQATYRAEWGVCPDHGNTLTSSGGRAWCSTPECGRSWDWDHGGRPCTEPAAFRVRGRDYDPGRWGLVCPGHALAALDQLEGVELLPHESRTAESGGTTNERPARPTMSLAEWRALPPGYKTVHRELGPMVLRLDPRTGGTVSQAVDLQFGRLEGRSGLQGRLPEREAER
jgi:hypothetical protein